MARSRYKIFENNFPYFVTGTIVDWLPLFSKPDLVQILLDTLAFLQKMDRMILYAYVMMENHIHLIASSSNLSKELGDFKSFTARKIIDHLKEQHMDGILNKLAEEKQTFKHDRTYQFWQEGSHPQLIQSHDMMIQKVEYIHNNPVKRGYVADPIHWRYSSAGNYHDGIGLIPVCTEW
jgi:REP element-mobilizing transposase RayT